MSREEGSVGRKGCAGRLRDNLVLVVLTAALVVLTVLLVLLGLLGLVPGWVPLLEEHPEWWGYLAGPVAFVRFVQRWFWVVVAAWVVVGVACVVWARRSAIYEGLLWRMVVGPAVGRFGVEAARELPALGAGYADRLREMVRQLDFDSLWVLEGALARRRPGSVESVLEYPDGMRLEPPGSGAAEERPRFEGALGNLQGIGAIAGWESVGKGTVRNFSIKVVLPTADWRALERLRVAAEVELSRRSTMEALRALRAAERSEGLGGGGESGRRSWTSWGWCLCGFLIGSCFTTVGMGRGWWCWTTPC